MALYHWLPGEEVDAGDFQEENAEFLNLLGQLSGMFFASENFNSGLSAVAITQSGQTVTVGGVGQNCFVNGRLCTNVAPHDFLIAANPTANDRYDRIYGRAVELDVQPFQRARRNLDTSITPDATFYKTVHEIDWFFVPGDPTTGQPGPAPVGYAFIAQVHVYHNDALTINTMELQTLSRLLANVAVVAINGMNGPISFQSSDNSVRIDAAGGVVNLRTIIQQTIVSGLLGLSGNINLSSPNGSIGISTSGNTIQLVAAAAAAAVSSFNGYAGAVGLASDDGSLTVDSSSNVIKIRNNGVRSIGSSQGTVRNLAGANADLDTAGIFSRNNGSPGGYDVHTQGGTYAGGAVTASDGRYGLSIIGPPGRGATILSATATFVDASFSNAIDMAIESISGNSAIFTARYLNGSPPRGAGGVGFYYIIVTG